MCKLKLTYSFYFYLFKTQVSIVCKINSELPDASTNILQLFYYNVVMPISQLSGNLTPLLHKTEHWCSLLETNFTGQYKWRVMTIYKPLLSTIYYMIVAPFCCLTWAVSLWPSGRVCDVTFQLFICFIICTPCTSMYVHVSISAVV